jgi:hypothetical protein
MGLFYLGMVYLSARVKQGRLDVFLADLGITPDDAVPRLPAGNLV